MSKRRIVLEETGELAGESDKSRVFYICTTDGFRKSYLIPELNVVREMGGSILRVVRNDFADPPVNSPETPDSSVIADPPADELSRLKRTVAFMEEQYLKGHGGSWGECKYQKLAADQSAIIAELVAYLWQRLDACEHCEDDSCGHCTDIKSLIEKAGGGERTDYVTTLGGKTLAGQNGGTFPVAKQPEPSSRRFIRCTKCWFTVQVPDQRLSMQEIAKLMTCGCKAPIDLFVRCESEGRFIDRAEAL